MADSVTMEVSGLRELVEKMRAMGPDIAEKTLRSAVRAAGVVIRDEARAKAPEESGDLKKALAVVFSRKRSNEFSKTFVVGVPLGKRKYASTRRNVRKQRAGAEYEVEGPEYYWRFLEFGTVKMRARPFLRPAFESKKKEAVDVIAARIAARIKRYERRGK